MQGKKMYTDEFKLTVVKEYLEGKAGGFRAVAEKHNVDYAQLRRWVNLYKAGGIDALLKVQRTYSGDFKVAVVEYMHNNSMSINMTAAHFGIQSPPTVKSWERIYYQEGKEALYEERRGRSKAMSKKKKVCKDVNTNEDLLAEVQRLRMENEYLKKLNALIQEKEKAGQQKK